MTQMQTLERRVAALECAQNDTTETLQWVVGKLGQMSSVQDDHTVRLERLETGLEELRAEVRTGLSSLRTEFRSEVSSLRTELSSARTEFRTEMASLRRELPEMIADVMREVLKERRS